MVCTPAFAARSTSSAEVFESGVKGHSQYTVFPAAIAARTASSCCGPVVSTRTMSTSGWRTNSSIDPTTCLIPKVSAADSRHFILRHKAEHANGAVQSPVSDADQANTDDRVVGRGGTAVGYRR